MELEVSQLTWADLTTEHEPEIREVLLESLGGTVTIRELDAGEMMLCHTAAMSGVEEDLRIDNQKLNLIKIAASLENPSLGDTVADRIMRYQEVEKLPSRAFTILVREIEDLSNINLSRVATLSKMIDSVPFLYCVFRVLAEKNGWLKDLDGVTVRELEEWMAFYSNNDVRFREMLVRLMGDVKA